MQRIGPFSLRGQGRAASEGGGCVDNKHVSPRQTPNIEPLEVLRA